jgi:uncharacterized membrane protein
MESETDEISGEVLNLIAHWSFFGLFLLAFALVLVTLLTPVKLPGKPGWPEAVLLLSAAASVCASMSRQLPAQNVLLAAGVIAFIGSVAHVFGARSGIPFGPFTPGEGFGPKLKFVPWAVPFIWVTSVLASRGVARLILRPWRKLRTYGFWLMGLTCVLSVVLQLAFDPFATRVHRYWVWNATRLNVDWHGAPLVNFISWGLIVLLILAFATPALINKRPRRSPPDYHPLIIWMALGVLFATGAATQQLWTAVVVFVVAAGAVVVFAIRGGTW